MKKVFMAKKKQNQKKNETKISQPKGRPMLNWVGKKPLDYIKSFPAQLMEVYNPLKTSEPLEKPTFNELEKNWQNLLFHGDNKEVLGYLLNNGFRGKVDLIYIDPPFDSGADYVRKVELRKQVDRKTLEAIEYSLGEQVQYFDIWNNDGYLQFLYERLLLLKEFLTQEGSIYLHCDYRRSAYIKVMMDEVFGADNFLNEIIWKRKGGMVADINRFGVVTDTLFIYSKSSDYIFNPQYTKINT
ncbi:MAG TPA: site-specific DNA-methyltransferase, partial [Ignavibacteria bacterium]|nr:site-specific DNA-methyltransferase [Ignavibacteria bacterium]